MLNVLPEDLEALTPINRRRTLSLLEAQEDRQGQRLFFEMYPDVDTPWEGPTILGGLVESGQIIHSRSKYPKHMECLAAGAKYRERCAMFGNRCITPWTYIETPDGPGLSAEVWTSKDARVLSWDGESRCVAPAQDGYLKGIEQAFRIVLDNGRFFDCSRKHRVLTTEGWFSLDQLVYRASGLRCWHRREDYQASCVEDGYFGDRPLRSIAGIDLEQPPLPVGAQRRAPLVFELTDEVERRFQCIRAYPQSDRLSNRDGFSRIVDLFSLFAGPASDKSYVSLPRNTQAVVRLAAELRPHLQSASLQLLDRCGGDARPDADLMLFLGESCTQIAQGAKDLAAAQWCDVQGPGVSIQEWFRDVGHIPIFYPSFHPELVGGERIAAIVPLGYQPIIDAHVPGTKNYWAGGVVHHNTGKTLGVGGYEMSCHLTGLYPEWWEGRRFDNPISAWAAGKSYETTRDILQLTLLGEVSFRDGRKTVDGRGVIPGHLIGRNTWRSGISDVVDRVIIKHVSGGHSFLGLKSYDQGRKAFEGTGRHVCIAEGELVQMVDGTLRPVELVQAGESVLSLNRIGEVVQCRVKGVHDNGERECVMLQPKNGSPIVLTPDHEVFWGYSSESKVKAQDAKAVAQVRPGLFWPPVSVEKHSAWYVWAGLVVSDGCISQRKVTNGNIETMQHAVDLLPSKARVRRKTFKSNHVDDWVLYWDDLWAALPDKALAGDKTIPGWVFQSSKANARLFLRWLYFGDGWASKHLIGYATTSKALADGIVVLLNRLGIRAACFVRAPARKNWEPQYWVMLTKAADTLKFCTDIGIEGKGAAVDKVVVECKRRLESIKKRSEAMHKARRGDDYVRKKEHNTEHWRKRQLDVRLKSSKVRKLVTAGVKRVYDLSVEDQHRFLSGVNLVKNCWFDEEPPMEVYGEALIRTATLNGIIILTFTPLSGLSEVVLSFMPADQRPDIND